MELASQFLYPVLGFLGTVGFGLWLSRRGRPYPGLLFNVHKLVALATVILTGLAVYRLIKELDTGTATLLFLGVAVVGVITLFASGAFLSANKGEYRVMKRVHNIALFAAVIAMGCTIFLL